jgi:hypothetical protein
MLVRKANKVFLDLKGHKVSLAYRVVLDRKAPLG